MTNAEQFAAKWEQLKQDNDKHINDARIKAKANHPGVSYYDTPEYEEARKTSLRLSDGIYDLTGLNFLVLDGEDGRIDARKKEDAEEVAAEALAFMNAHPNFVWGSAYQTYAMVLVSARPPRFTGTKHGTDFNYGVTAVLENCPCNVLIMAEDD